ncbi:MAG: hypothetical protein EBS05_23205 [Proteobacteria bacterium]|nr:hypothetical protein [Pseudomonadota bacterium]
MSEDPIEEFSRLVHFPPENELSKAWRERNDERFAMFGMDFVSDAVGRSIFESVVSPCITDFIGVRKGVFAKRIDEDICHVLTFKQGARAPVYSLRFGWGVSLSFVPHKWDDGCKFHRTLKSARRDLFDYEHNLIKDDPATKFFAYNELDMMHGEVCFRDDLVRAWKNLEPVIRAWLGSITSLEGVLKQARFQMNHYNWDSAKLVYAFTLARMGRLEEGLIALEELRKLEHRFYSSDELPKAFRKIAKGNPTV